MSTKNEKFLEQLRATFKVEAEEHLQAITAGLLELEKTPAAEQRRRIVETVFRAAHSLKGAARAVDFTNVESLCQSLEDVFASWRRQEGGHSPAVLDDLHRKLDAIGSALAAPASGRGTPVPAREPSRRSSNRAETPTPAPDGEAPDSGRAERMAENIAAAQPAGAPERTSTGESVRIAVAKLDAQIVAVEEMLAVKLTASQRASDLNELAVRFQAWRNAWSAVEPAALALRQVFDRRRDGAGSSAAEPQRLIEFFDWSVDFARSLEDKAAALGRTAEQDRRLVGRLVDELLEDSKKLLLLPFSTITASFPKLVRDLCRDQGKEAELAIRGGEVEIDKRVLEEMKDPIIHLLRNSIDHGIEAPERRTQLGKPARGTVTLGVSQVNGNKVELLVSDDGAGIDARQVVAAAITRGVITEEDARQLGEAQAQALVFQPEVSTSPMITRLSGRGLGLDIVREKAERLGGSVSLESRTGAGTSIRVVLPAMLATFHGVLVETAGRLFVVPTIHVERVARVKRDDVQTVEGREAIALDGRAVALVRLAAALELPPLNREGNAVGETDVIVLGTGEQRIAFAVDAVIEEREVLVKPLRRPLARVRNIAGATVLASGQVAPILNVADLLKSARKAGSVAARTAAGRTPGEAKPKAILVAEDSITSRMLLKSILEAAGYTVKTAVDGMEAFTLLRTEHIDLVVSDVEMPRLDGFDLTERIRADKKLSELPVVLVTALETREDRERGVDVGADAYIVKSSFDESDLLEAIRRLI